MLCSNCGKALPADSPFCPFCGVKQTSGRSCPKCGELLLENAQFCRRCGSRVDDHISREAKSIFDNSAANEPFYKQWLAEHKQLAETKRITWISEFKGNYAVAIDDDAPGRELRPFLVRGKDTAEIICYMSWTGANVANGVLERNGDCFRNGTRYISFILFSSNSMVSSGEYKRILQDFTGVSETYGTSGIAVLVSRDGKVLMASQYRESVTGIADMFPIRMIGEKYCVYTPPQEYNQVTANTRYNAASEQMLTVPQQVIDCDSGSSVLDNVFVPKYDGDPSGYFVEYFNYSKDLVERVLHNSSVKEKERCYFNRRTGRIYTPESKLRFYAEKISVRNNANKYLLLEISEIRPDMNLRGETFSGNYELISEDDVTVIKLGRHDLQYLPEIVEAGGRIYICTHSPEIADESGKVNCANNVTNVYCFEKQATGVYTRITAGKLRTGGGFADGVVRIHSDDGKSDDCYGAFEVKGKTYISLIKERDDSAEDYDKCLILDDSLKTICWFNYKQHYGSQAPYGVHIFSDIIYSLSSEEDETGEEVAVLKNIINGETVFSVPSEQLISNASAEFGKSRIRLRYEFGSYRVGGVPFFLIGKQNRGLGIMDIRGRIVIPQDKQNYFIVSGNSVGMVGEGQHAARLPADSFLVVLGGFDADRYKVCRMDGTAEFEGSMAELAEKYG